MRTMPVTPIKREPPLQRRLRASTAPRSRRATSSAASSQNRRDRARAAAAVAEHIGAPVTPCSVSTSTSSSGAACTAAALVPSTIAQRHLDGDVLRTLRSVNAGSMRGRHAQQRASVGVQRQDVGDGAVQRRRQRPCACRAPPRRRPASALRAGCRARGRDASTRSCRRRQVVGELERAPRRSPRRGSTPCARPTATTSRMTSSRKARVCGCSRIGPIVLRIVVVVPDSPTRNTYFCQISRRMSSESSALMPPARQASRNACPRGEREPSNSPNSSRCIGPVWRMTPGRSMVVAT